MSVITRVQSVLRLTHGFPTVFVVSLSAALLLLIHGGAVAAPLFLRACVVVLLSQIAVGTLNDYVDRYDDAVTQPQKPIPIGAVPAWAAALTAITAALLLPVVAAPLGLIPAATAVVGLTGGIAYDLWLKRTPYGFIGYVVGFLSLVTFLWLVAGHITIWFLLVLPTGIGLVLCAHLANAYPDVETDQGLGSRGLAAILGPDRTRVVIVASGVLVMGAGLALSISREITVAVLGFSLGTVVLVVAALIEGGSSRERPARLVFFRCVAGACGISALAGVVLIRSISK